MKEKQLMEGRKGREKYLEERLWRAGPQDLFPVTWIKENLVSDVPGMILCSGSSVAPSIYHYRHNQRLLLLKY